MIFTIEQEFSDLILQHLRLMYFYYSPEPFKFRKLKIYFVIHRVKI